MGKKKKQKKSSAGSDVVELNVMPFVDIFSLLCTFLLFSAVFVAIGIHEVQIPFLSNATPPKTKSKRMLEVKVDVTKTEIELITSYTQAPVNEQAQKFPRTKKGFKEFHRKLIDVKIDNRDAEKVELFMDEELTYNDLIEVLDNVKLLMPNDKGFKKETKPGTGNMLFPKVIMGNVLL